MTAVQERDVEGDPDADVQALMVENVRLEAQLDGLYRALQSRATIEQAKGVLMAIAQCTEAEAFELLVQLSQRRNVRLRLVAEALLKITSAGFETDDEDVLQHWLRGELVRLGQRSRPARNHNGGRPRS